jgi:hypothetical protein
MYHFSVFPNCSSLCEEIFPPAREQEDALTPITTQPRWRGVRTQELLSRHAHGATNHRQSRDPEFAHVIRLAVCARLKGL